MTFAPKIKENRWNPDLEKKIRETWDREKIYVFKINIKKVTQISLESEFI